MNIISLFDSFVNYFSHFLSQDSISLHDLEANIIDATHNLNLETLASILEYIDLNYKLSDERKLLFHVKETRTRTLITSLGLVTFNKTYYKSKSTVNGKHHYFSYIEDYLGVDKWAKMTLRAEVNIINNSLLVGMSWAANNTIPCTTISRQTISKKIKNINYNLTSNIIPSTHTPDTLYIEADEVHANLQRPNKNRIVPVILTHEGHKEAFVNKKQLKNTHYIASSILQTDKLWNETYNFLDTKYDLAKVKYLFISGDGAPWIKQYLYCFPNAIYVLDKFHYRQSLNYIFKRDPLLTKLADDYLRNRSVDAFKQLVTLQCEAFPHQSTKMIKQEKYLLNNIDGIINQRHPMYKCPCSMEGHISNMYARFITSRPHSYSLEGLENIVQLLTMKANGITLTEDIFHQFKYGESTYHKLNLERFISDFRLQASELHNHLTKYNSTYSVDDSSFTSHDNYRLDFFLNKRP